MDVPDIDDAFIRPFTDANFIDNEKIALHYHEYDGVGMDLLIRITSAHIE